MSQAGSGDTVELVFAGGSYGQNTVFLIVSAAFWAFSAAASDQPDLQTWLVELRQDARDGISEATLDAALTGVQLIPRVIELDRKQPEFTLTFAQYLERVVPASRQQRARARYDTHRELLTEIGDKYGVQPVHCCALGD